MKMAFKAAYFKMIALQDGDKPFLLGNINLKLHFFVKRHYLHNTRPIF